MDIIEAASVAVALALEDSVVEEAASVAAAAEAVVQEEDFK